MSVSQPAEYLQNHSLQQASIYSTGQRTEQTSQFEEQPYTSKIHSFYEDLYLTDLKNDLSDLSQQVKEEQANLAFKDHLIAKLKKENEQLRRVVNSYRKKAQDFKPHTKTGTITPQRSEQDYSSRQNLHHAKVCDIDRLSRLLIFAKETALSDRIRKRYDKLIEHLFVSLTDLVPFESVCVFAFSTDLFDFAKIPEGVQHFKTVLEGKWLDMFVPA